MENIYAVTKPKKKYKAIMVSEDIANRLASLKKGSYNSTIKSLLGERQDTGTKVRLDELEDSITQIQEFLEKLKRFNPNLRI